MSLISVIITCYNQEKYIAECLDSVLAQSFKDFEAIVVDDGSVDNSLEIIKQYAQKYPQIKVISQNNSGVIAARNNAIKQAEGIYIYPLDGDDTIEPQCLEKQYAAAVENKGDVIWSYIRKFGAENKVVTSHKISIWTMCDCNFVPACALYRKSDWEKYGGYDAIMDKGYEDWEFWCNFVEEGKTFYCVPEVLQNYRILEVSRNKFSKKIAKEMKKNLFRKHKKIAAARLLLKICRFFYNKKVKNDKMVVKIFKIVVYKRKINRQGD